MAVFNLLRLASSISQRGILSGPTSIPIRLRAVLTGIGLTSQNKASTSQKLETCFRWVMKRYYRTWRRFSQGGKAWYAVNANDHFERGCGDCIADASAFAYLAKALGYKNVYVCTDGYRNDENSHGWAEINGRVYDPLFAEAKSYSRNYGVYPLSPVMRVKIA